MGHRRNLAKVFVEGASGRRTELVGEAGTAAEVDHHRVTKLTAS
jgi:hypothetical protein